MRRMTGPMFLRVQSQPRHKREPESKIKEKHNELVVHGQRKKSKAKPVVAGSYPVCCAPIRLAGTVKEAATIAL